MIEFLLARSNFPFTISLMVMLIIALLEGITTLLGSGIFAFLDSLIPDLDMDLDLDVDPSQLSSAGPFTKFLIWIRVGEVPAIILLILLLTSFGLFGLGIQFMSRSLTGFLFPASLVSFPSILLALLVTRNTGRLLAKIIPKDESDAVSEDSLVGRVAVIVLGRAEMGKPAQARLKDTHGQTHYVMVEPDSPDITFAQGQTVLIVQRNGSVFQATDQIPDCLVS